MGALGLLIENQMNTDRIPPSSRVFHFTRGYGLPGTRLFIAKHKEEVVATAVLIPDSAFGLPCDSFCSLQDLRGKGQLLGEMISPLVRDEYYESRFDFLKPMMRMIFQWCKDQEKWDGLLIASPLETELFYQNLCFFSPIEKDALPHDEETQKGTPVSPLPPIEALPHYFSFDDGALRSMEEFYLKKPNLPNLYHYFFSTTGSLNSSPSEDVSNSIRSFDRLGIRQNSDDSGVSKVDLMKQFPQLLRDWGPKDFQVIANLDLHKLFRTKATSSPQERGKSNILTMAGFRERKSPRVAVRFKAWAFFPGESKPRESLVTDISNEGFQLKADGGEIPLQQGNEFMLVFEIKGQLVHLESRIQWIRNETKIGCSLLAPNEKWKALVQEVYAEVLGRLIVVPKIRR